MANLASILRIVTKVEYIGVFSIIDLRLVSTAMGSLRKSKKNNLMISMRYDTSLVDHLGSSPSLDPHPISSHGRIHPVA